MSSKKQLRKIDKHQENIHEKENNDEKKCNLKFSKCDDNKYQLWDLGKLELKQFVSFAKKIENLRWIDIFTIKSFHYENINNLQKPDFLSEDITLKSIRVTQEFRIYGYRSEADFYIIWFDPYHKLT